jgi:hypothetical protein
VTPPPWHQVFAFFWHIYQSAKLLPSLNVSSYGDTLEAARQSLAEAVEAFIEECHEMGTLEEVLEESGFVKTSSAWQARQPVKEMNLAIAI